MKGDGESRRAFLRGLGGAIGAAGFAATTGCSESDVEAFMQQHYRRLTDEEKRLVFERLEQETERQYGVRVNIEDPPPLEGVTFGYALNLTYCIGCRRCEYACVRENNTSRDPQIHYIRVLRMQEGAINVEASDHYYEGTVPDEESFYMPVQCHQCENPPCVRACPVGATWSEPDGVVVVDYNWCIGCRYCQAACPYFARRFNFTDPTVRPSDINPDQAYLSNRLRMAGVVEKCTFCLQRTRRGRYPACVEVCPTGARKFGNLRDPSSEVRQVLEHKRVYVFREELGTIPRFFYFFS